MKTKLLITILIFSSLVLSCSSRSQIKTARGMSVDVSFPDTYTLQETPLLSGEDTLTVFTDKEGISHSIGRSTIDEKTGEQLLTVGLEEVKVTARFKNVAERAGRVHIEFNICILPELMNDNWELCIRPKSNTMQLPGIIVPGTNFLSKQKKQYSYYDELCKVIISENDLDRFVNRRDLEKYLACHNREVMREAKLSGKKTIRTKEYTLDNREDTLTFVDRFMNHKLVNRNEYFKRALNERFFQIVTLKKQNNIQEVLSATPDSMINYSYTAEIPATDATDRISLSMCAEIRTLNGDIYPLKVSDSLTFVVSTLRSFIKEIKNAPAEYRTGLALLKVGKYEQALEQLRPYADINTAINYLALGYDMMAFNTLKKLPEDSDNLYLLAIAAYRIGREADAVDYYKVSVLKESAKRWRGNLDPEISGLIRKYNLNDDNI